ncbi:hypothetical protein [Deinococcus multiflagellatus]|uniref:hypothetical protein n=1 Tax=Deinococcus multiflagellatus TaxID=1656887 RepID=UPI001CCD485E|nr:hypothetical protein [Deinococcus multiflagellatus]MBZ9712710.1 hypothetical protein [Deinococcus multiflagellatus]
MSLKDKFSGEEWFTVMNGPGRAGAAVMAASPSGVTGLLAEGQALGLAVRQGLSAAGRTPLLEAMAADLLGTPPDPGTVPRQERARNMDEAREQSLQGVRQAAWLVSAKTSPEDAAAYRHLLLSVAEQVALAAKEGGFLGIGGEQVSERERAVIEELRRLLGGTEAAPAPTPLSAPAPDGSGNSN